MDQKVSVFFDSLLAALLTCVDLILSLVIMWWVGRWELQALLCESGRSWNTLREFLLLKNNERIVWLDMTWWCCSKWCAKTRKAEIKQSPMAQILWVCLFLPIHNQVSYSLFNPFGWVLLSRTWVFHSPGDRYVYKSWYKYVIIPRTGSFEQEVSLPFPWIVMFSIICSSCWCVYFLIPRMDSFE